MVLKLDGAGQNDLEEDQITWYSNDFIRQLANQTGLEGYEITWFSNTCYTFQPEHTWEAEEIAEFSNKDVGGFAL